ncbi:STAS domain-containing protein [Flavobacterium sp.]|uniref:STAS domain-containing protein n=1 Tax=Flavobacterium sp. TaxID=239 RepID=UPI002635254B|nr:STAS domain-containing protein [Flavobacterium sp.]
MALQITNNAGIFEINGDLNSQNVLSLNNHFEALLERSKMITLSLNKLVDIDTSAVSAIASLYKKAMSSNKIFYIIGQENQKISDRFQTEKLSYILRRDVL